MKFDLKSVDNNNTLDEVYGDESTVDPEEVRDEKCNGFVKVKCGTDRALSSQFRIICGQIAKNAKWKSGSTDIKKYLSTN